MKPCFFWWWNSEKPAMVLEGLVLGSLLPMLSPVTWKRGLCDNWGQLWRAQQFAAQQIAPKTDLWIEAPTLTCLAWWDGLRTQQTLFYKAWGDFIKMFELANKCSPTPLRRIFALSLSKSKEGFSSTNNWRTSSSVAELGSFCQEAG